MLRFLRRALARPEAVTGDELLAEPTTTVLAFPARSKDSPGDILMMNGLWAPVPWATLPGAGYSFARSWPIGSRDSFEIAAGMVLSAEAIERALTRP